MVIEQSVCMVSVRFCVKPGNYKEDLLLVIREFSLEVQPFWVDKSRTGRAATWSREQE